MQDASGASISSSASPKATAEAEAEAELDAILLAPLKMAPIALSERASEQTNGRADERFSCCNQNGAQLSLQIELAARR